MQYLERELERKFLEMNKCFKAILVTGARQVGKTTMLKHFAKGTNRSYVSMDNIVERELAKSDPILFFQKFQPPIIIDEIQKAPELLEQIKIICDESEETGLFWITGSQQFQMMKHIRESLAGRIGILTLYGLSQREKQGILLENGIDFSLQGFVNRKEHFPKNNIIEVYKHIWNGGLPFAQNLNQEMRIEYLNSYIETYLLRDASESGGVSDTVKFSKFLSACAALVSQQVNYTTLAEATEISVPTAKSWLNILQGLGIIYLLRPYENNEIKRLAKMPKLYFCDTALCAFLSTWLSPEALMNGAASGYYYENYVVMELVKAYAYSKNRANISYYRDSNAKEIDLFVEENNTIHPLEIKKSANPKKQEVKKFSVIEKTSLEKGYGGIICMCENVIPIDNENCFIPSNII